MSETEKSLPDGVFVHSPKDNSGESCPLMIYRKSYIVGGKTKWKIGCYRWMRAKMLTNISLYHFGK